MTTEHNERIRTWTKGVTVDAAALTQLENVARLPSVQPYVAVMPDVHVGKGATVGSVIPTVKAIIPAAVGVDIGCGMMATRTTLTASDLPESLREVRHAIERAVPHGRTNHGGRGDRGAWSNPPKAVENAWSELAPGYRELVWRHRSLDRGQDVGQLGTLGTGNHFIEVCLDESDRVWLMLHSGSRGVGNRIGSHFISLAKEEMLRLGVDLPDKDLSYLEEGTTHFHDYVTAVEWAQRYAAKNRELMMDAVVRAVSSCRGIPPFTLDEAAVNCHHNYVSREHHAGRDVYVTRKGAVRARQGELGIIPGSMGACSYIVRGKGNAESFESCSHGAGRLLSRTAARKAFTVEDHAAATAGVECRKDEDVIDETPAAYKPIDAVMEAQKDLVEVAHRLKQVVCVKG
jgi:tRNA-splicing ligase RtcB